MPTGLRVASVLLIMILLPCIDGNSKSCSDREQSSLCFCRSNDRHPTPVIDLFLAKVSLTQCSTPSAIRQCHQGRFSPSLTHVTQLVPNLVNLSHCLKDTHCLYSLRSSQRCQRCQIVSSSPVVAENTSYVISTSRTHLPTDSCFYLCERDPSCGFLCFDRRVSMKISCDFCRGRRSNVTCRCIRERPSDSCLAAAFETTTPRWMQKRGFPAAGILALLVLVTILLIIAGKLINRRLEVLTRRKSNSIRRSIATITTYRSRQPSPLTVISFPNTPSIPPMNQRKDVVTPNTMVELISAKSQEYVVDIHRRNDEDELSVFLLEKTSQINPAMQQIADIDDDEEEAEEENDDKNRA